MNTIGGLQNAPRLDVDMTMISGLKYKLHEADVERKNQIKTVADFLKQVLPTSPYSELRDASHSDTQTEHGSP